jgi:hypothetical protein
MTAPPLPFDDRVAAGLAQIEEALRQAPGAAREETRQVLDSDELVKRVVNIVTPVMDERFRKKYYRSMIIGVGILLAIFAVAVTAAFQQIAQVASINAATNTDQDAAISRSQVSIGAFQQQLDEANKKLIAQGLPPIPGPTDAQPGTPQQAQLSVAAATASTLAAIPKDSLASPSAASLAQAVADYMQAHPAGVDPSLIIGAVADYFAANQDSLRGPAGADGADGVPGPSGPAGPPPTAEQIQVAFRDEIANNPQLLCPVGGTYSGRTVALANGGSTQQFGCFGEDTAAPPPDTGGGGGGGNDQGGASEGEQPGNSDGGGAAVPPARNDNGGQVQEAPTQAPETVQEQPPVTSAPEPTPTTTEEPPTLLDDLLGVG